MTHVELLRWSKQEAQSLQEMRKRLEDVEVDPCSPELCCDRKLIRFLRGSNGNVAEASQAYINFINWRKDNDIDSIRRQILFEGINHPSKFPKGELIIQLAPQIIIVPTARDRKGQILQYESFGFEVAMLFENVTIDDLLTFLKYSLEFRALVLEQLSDEEERGYLQDIPLDLVEEGFGVVLRTCVIRDLRGVGMAHAGSKAVALIKASLNVAVANYPEYLGKAHLVNAPWIFNSCWLVIKGLMDTSVHAKISIYGTDFMDRILDEVPIESLPERVGGTMTRWNETFHFDLTPGGPFVLPLSSIDRIIPRVGDREVQAVDDVYDEVINGDKVIVGTSSNSLAIEANIGNADDVCVVVKEKVEKVVVKEVEEEEFESEEWKCCFSDVGVADDLDASTLTPSVGAISQVADKVTPRAIPHSQRSQHPPISQPRHQQQQQQQHHAVSRAVIRSNNDEVPPGPLVGVADVPRLTSHDPGRVSANAEPSAPNAVYPSPGPLLCIEEDDVVVEAERITLSLDQETTLLITDPTDHVGPGAGTSTGTGAAAGAGAYHQSIRERFVEEHPIDDVDVSSHVAMAAMMGIGIFALICRLEPAFANVLLWSLVLSGVNVGLMLTGEDQSE